MFPLWFWSEVLIVLIAVTQSLQELCYVSTVLHVASRFYALVKRQFCLGLRQYVCVNVWFTCRVGFNVRRSLCFI